MDRGYIKFWRKSLDSGMIRNHKLWCLWTWCLLKATHETHVQRVGFQEITIEAGQFVFGRKAAAIELGMSEQNIRTGLDHLVRSKNLTIKSTNKFSIITVVNWPTYQMVECGNQPTNQHTTNQQVTSKSPASNHKQECKNRRSKDLDNPLLFPDPEDPTGEYSASDEAAHSNGTAFYLTRRKRKLTGKRLETFNQFWKAFKYPKGKAGAADAWLDIPQLTNALVIRIIEAAGKYAKARPAMISKRMTPIWAQGWLNDKRWEDEIVEPEAGDPETMWYHELPRGTQ